MSSSSPASGLRQSRAIPRGKWLRRGGAALLLGTACCMGEWAARVLWSGPPGTHAFAIAPPLLLALLILQAPRRWPDAMAAAGLGMMLALRLSGTDWAGALVLAAGPLLPAAALAWVVRRWGMASWPPADLWQGTVFLIGIGVLVPLFNVNWTLGWSQRLDLGYAIAELGGLLLAQIGGHLLLLPLLLAVARPSPGNDVPSRGKLAVAVILLLLPLLLWALPTLNWVPSALMTVAALPLLLWMLVEFGLIGVSGALLLLAALGIRFSLQGAGPFAGLPASLAMLALQSWICAMAAAMWLMSVLQAQKRVALRRLQAAYQQLSDLAGRILVVQEEERTRIARELHDDINQQLAAVSIRLSFLKRDGSQAQRQAVTEIQDDLLKASSDIRGMSHELHPSVLRFTGLDGALTAFCKHHGHRTTLQFDCQVDAPAGLTTDQQLGLFRIVQEAVNNIEKHAHARHAWVRLQVRGGLCVLSISDDGVGMASQDPARRGLGLISMEERARLLGGALQVHSTPGGGVRLEVRFPAPVAPPA
ncbi:MAG TPA: sensor histidine kinase [Bordetella sp.]|nr:sensor histidine kinase [Bordetella sp.]